MKKNKLFLGTLLVIASLSFSACKSSDGYVKCKSVKYGKDENSLITLEPVEKISIRVAKYKLSNQVSYLPTYGENKDSIYVVFNISNDKGKSFECPGIGTLTINNDGTEENAILTFLYEIGDYSNYKYIYYSQEKRTIKVEENSWGVVKASNDAEGQGKTCVLPSSYTSGKSNAVSIFTYASEAYQGLTIKTESGTSYIDVGPDMAVTYVTY